MVAARLKGGPFAGELVEVVGSCYRRLIAQSLADSPSRWKAAVYRWEVPETLGETGYVGVFAGFEGWSMANGEASSVPGSDAGIVHPMKVWGRYGSRPGLMKYDTTPLTAEEQRLQNESIGRITAALNGLGYESAGPPLVDFDDFVYDLPPTADEPTIVEAKP